MTRHDDAVTDLVPHRGAVDRSVGDTRADPRPTGWVPGLVGLLAGLLALAGAALVAVPGLALPGVGRAAESQVVLLGLVGVAVLGGACSALGVAPQRQGRPAAIAGLVASVAAVLALVAPLVALASV